MIWRAVVIAFAWVAPAAAQTAYMDDRSSPEAVVASLYNAINMQDFARAWSYFDPDRAPSFSAYVRGFNDTDRVDVRTFAAEPVATETGALWNVPVVLEARQDDGTLQVFAGCYQLAQAEPRRRPPYTPIAILQGHLHVHDGPADTAQGMCTWQDRSSSSVLSSP